MIAYGTLPDPLQLAESYQALPWKPATEINHKDNPFTSNLLIRLDFSLANIVEQLVLYTDNTTLYGTQVYLFQGSTLILSKPYGATIPLAERDIKTPFPNTLLPTLQPGTYSLVIYAKRRDHTSLTKDLWLISQTDLTEHVLQDKTYIGAGMIGAMMTYLVLGGILLWYRYDNSQVYGMLFLVGASLSLILRTGLLQQATTLDSLWPYVQLQPATYGMFIGAGTLYFRQRLGWTSWRKPLPVIIGCLGWLNLALAVVIAVAAPSRFLSLTIVGCMFVSVLSMSILALGALTLLVNSRPVDKIAACVWITLFSSVFIRTFRADISEPLSNHSAMLMNYASIACTAWIIFEGIITVVKEELRRRELIYSSQARIDLVNRLSHELRTPLNAVIGLTDLLKEQQSPQTSFQYAQMIQSAGRTLLSLVNDILDFSKLSNQRIKFSREPFRLDRVIIDCIVGFLPQQIEKAFLPEVTVDPKCPFFLVGDSHRLRQILDNLISNAYKFTDKNGSIQVDITTGEVNGNQQQVIIRVKDNGRGIPEEMIDKIFKPYEQVSSTDATKFKGTGLGLPITKLLVEQMSGTISVTSTLSEGSEFCCTLWFSIAKQQPDLSSLFAPIKGKRFLFATTSPHFIRSMGDYLEHWGASVDWVQLEQHSKTIATEGYDGLIIYTDYLVKNTNLEWINASSVPVIFSIAGSDTQWLQRLHTHVVPIPPLSSALDTLAEIASELGGVPVQLPGMDSSPTININLEKHHVLLVDDNPVNLTVTQRILESLRISCENVDNGKEALSRLQTSPDKYSLVLLDCEMPDMDGFTVARRWRDFEEQHQLPPLPVVALTAHALDEVDERCLSHGMNDILHKPVTKRHLEEVLTRFG